ncbi:Tat pathway signal protein [Streptomyces noursei]|uniref:Tat pathway signal protein n=1 Tax=Streptomyces noursei TaxID=1971 RepID=UPI0019C29CDC|nr:Tat pathway signal protein [Streptomyces noursei]MCZ1014085.1 Tat pathway signal protein [Streptomyces noursei]GGX50771.1 Tat pathway signal protein [Streptomyces noursei]
MGITLDLYPVLIYRSGGSVNVVKDRFQWWGRRMARERNERLAALLVEAGWSRAQAAAAYNRVAVETLNGEVRENSKIGRSHVSMWVGGVQPSGIAPAILCQALSRRLKREITPQEAGFAASTSPAQGALDWRVDPLIALNDLGSGVDTDRRRLLASGVYSAAALILPDEAWWDAMSRPPTDEPPTGRRVGHGDVETMRELTLAFSRMDQRRGGGHGRQAVDAYLRHEALDFLQGRFADDETRRAMFSATAELAYVSGWMAFDNSEHAVALQRFNTAVKLAARSGDAPLSGHILRAMAHQALDLGFRREALQIAQASVHGQRYAAATPRERALLGVVHARTLAANDHSHQAAQALLRAEDDLSNAHDGIREPERTFFFGEASLAHETACTLRDLGDHHRAIKEFGSDAGLGDRLGHAAWRAGVVMTVSNSMGVSRPSAACVRRRW